MLRAVLTERTFSKHTRSDLAYGYFFSYVFPRNLVGLSLNSSLRLMLLLYVESVNSFSSMVRLSSMPTWKELGPFTWSPIQSSA